MTISYRSISLAFFWLCQPFVYYVFIEYGRDTHMYLDMARGVGASYLEPFWTACFYLLGFLSSNYLVNFLFMYAVLVMGSYLFLSKALDHCSGGLGYIATSFLIVSIQLSVVGGAFRQGIAVFLFSYFLLSMNRFAWFISVTAHWSGALFAIFYARARYFFPILLAATLSGFVSFAFLSSDDIALVRRLMFYLSNPFESNSGVLYGVVATKLIVFFLFCFNASLLSRCQLVQSWSVMQLVYVFSPVIQVIPFVLTGSQQVLHRFGMIFDPFVFVFFVVIASNAGLLSRLLVFTLVLVKLVSRIVIVINV